MHFKRGGWFMYCRCGCMHCITGGGGLCTERGGDVHGYCMFFVFFVFFWGIAC